MKKALALALVMILGLAACTKKAPAAALYLPNKNADGFVTKEVRTDGTIEDIVALLVAEEALPAGCAPLSFSPDGEAALDMNEAFRLAVTTTGTTGEYLTFGSLVNTVLAYYGLESVYVTAGGRVIESGHAVYDKPLRFHENHQGA